MGERTIVFEVDLRSFGQLCAGIRQFQSKRKVSCSSLYSHIMGNCVIDCTGLALLMHFLCKYFSFFVNKKTIKVAFDSATAASNFSQSISTRNSNEKEQQHKQKVKFQSNHFLSFCRNSISKVCIRRLPKSTFKNIFCILQYTPR